MSYSAHQIGPKFPILHRRLGNRVRTPTKGCGGRGLDSADAGRDARLDRRSDAGDALADCRCDARRAVADRRRDGRHALAHGAGRARYALADAGGRARRRLDEAASGVCQLPAPQRGDTNLANTDFFIFFFYFLLLLKNYYYYCLKFLNIYQPDRGVTAPLHPAQNQRPRLPTLDPEPPAASPTGKTVAKLERGNRTHQRPHHGARFSGKTVANPSSAWQNPRCKCLTMMQPMYLAPCHLTHHPAANTPGHPLQSSTWCWCCIQMAAARPRAMQRGLPGAGRVSVSNALETCRRVPWNLTCRERHAHPRLPP
jgi:hypothetical protein